MVANVRKSMVNRRSRQSADPGHQADPAASQRSRFHRDKTPEALFIQNRCHLTITLACIARLRGPNHPATLRRSIPPRESHEQKSSGSVVIMTHSFMDGPLVLGPYFDLVPDSPSLWRLRDVSASNVVLG